MRSTRPEWGAIGGVRVATAVATAMLTACTTTSAARYPLQWPVIAAQTEVRCAVAGDYENLGEVARSGETRFPTTSYLDTLVRPHDGGAAEPSRTGRVRVFLEPSALLIDARDVSTVAILRVVGGRDACERDGGYVIRFSEPYGSENGSGTLHTTQSIASASDGSLVIKSILYFDASKSVFRHRQETIVWYRFTRLL